MSVMVSAHDVRTAVDVMDTASDVAGFVAGDADDERFFTGQRKHNVPLAQKIRQDSTVSASRYLALGQCSAFPIGKYARHAAQQTINMTVK